MVIVRFASNPVAGNAASDPFAPWPELIAVALVVGLQWWRRNALLSIVLGVCAYVAMRNF